MTKLVHPFAADHVPEVDGVNGGIDHDFLQHRVLVDKNGAFGIRGRQRFPHVLLGTEQVTSRCHRQAKDNKANEKERFGRASGHGMEPLRIILLHQQRTLVFTKNVGLYAAARKQSKTKRGRRGKIGRYNRKDWFNRLANVIEKELACLAELIGLP